MVNPWRKLDLDVLILQSYLCFVSAACACRSLLPVFLGNVSALAKVANAAASNASINCFMLILLGRLGTPPMRASPLSLALRRASPAAVIT